MLDHIKLELKSLATCKPELLNRVFRIICDPAPDPLEEAWQSTPVFLPGESPWTEEPGGLQSMGSQRVGHD